MKMLKYTPIIIRFHYGAWYPVSRERARDFCEFLMRRRHFAGGPQ